MIPINNFNPILCGFVRRNEHSQWYNKDKFSIRMDKEDGAFLYESMNFVCKMPASHSESIELLKLRMEVSEFKS
jgi:hypothetical protein